MLSEDLLGSVRLPVPVPEVFVHLSVNATRSNRDAWGDTPYAEGLARAIRQVPGCDAALLFRGEAPERRGAGDVVLRLVGPHLDEPVPGLPNLIWMISPPNLAPVAMLARHQAVFSASASLAARLTAAGVPVEYLPQATDPARFHPPAAPRGRRRWQWSSSAAMPRASGGGWCSTPCAPGSSRRSGARAGRMWCPPG